MKGLVIVAGASGLGFVVSNAAPWLWVLIAMLLWVLRIVWALMGVRRAEERER